MKIKVGTLRYRNFNANMQVGIGFARKDGSFTQKADLWNFTFPSPTRFVDEFCWSL